jgi:hypothetical protein
VKSFPSRPTPTGGSLGGGPPVTYPPPGWQQKLDRALAIWHRSSAETTTAGLRKASIAHRLLATLLAQRP